MYYGSIYKITLLNPSIKRGFRPKVNKKCPCRSGKKFKDCCKTYEEITPRKVYE